MIYRHLTSNTTLIPPWYLFLEWFFILNSILFSIILPLKCFTCDLFFLEYLKNFPRLTQAFHLVSHNYSARIKMPNTGLLQTSPFCHLSIICCPHPLIHLLIIIIPSYVALFCYSIHPSNTHLSTSSSLHSHTTYMHIYVTYTIKTYMHIYVAIYLTLCFLCQFTHHPSVHLSIHFIIYLLQHPHPST